MVDPIEAAVEAYNGLHTHDQFAMMRAAIAAYLRAREPLLQVGSDRALLRALAAAVERQQESDDA